MENQARAFRPEFLRVLMLNIGYLILSYLLSGFYMNLYFIYAFIEISSLSYNLRQIFPSLDTPHKFIYLFIKNR